ncbi:MAG: phosphopentomutase [Verrucomicrobiota bacterium]
MRALVIVLDSVGIGGAPDAGEYGDEGANTLGNILGQTPDFRVPNLCKLGLPEILPDRMTLSEADSPDSPARQSPARPYLASFGKMQERSAGKDTTTGHWEIAGVILEQPFATFERFPDELTRAIEHEAEAHFIGNCARSGTAILDELGTEHVRTGHPILYTSADSVLQIAAHEQVVPLERLYEICRIARHHADHFRIGRVIARPFLGVAGNFQRTAHRHDFSMQPPRTILDAICKRGLSVIGIGKISDIFAGQGITQSFPTESNHQGMARIDQLWSEKPNGLLFANLVDFDMLHGHRRDVAGYARVLEEFDHWLGNFIPKVSPDDLVILTADHGNDPTFRGTDHTREEVPLFVLHHGDSRNLGTRSTFADVAATLAKFFELPAPWPIGCSVLNPTTPA